jgi:hypothetical protein
VLPVRSKHSLCRVHHSLHGIEGDTKEPQGIAALLDLACPL